MRYDVASDRGLIKSQNQDAYLLRIANQRQHQIGLLAVMDGVSSCDDGAYASRFVRKALEQLFETLKKQKRDLCEEVMKIHSSLREDAKKHRQTLGTTLSLVYYDDDDLHLIQVGDSRIYLYQHQLKQISVDQTLARMKYDAKIISLQEYHASEEHHILTQCMGMSKQLHLQEERLSWQKKDALLLCSDGIFNQLRHDDLQNHVQMFLNNEPHIAQKLIDIALAQEEQDNMTALLYTRSDR